MIKMKYFKIIYYFVALILINVNQIIFSMLPILMLFKPIIKVIDYPSLLINHFLNLILIR